MNHYSQTYYETWTKHCNLCVSFTFTFLNINESASDQIALNFFHSEINVDGSMMIKACIVLSRSTLNNEMIWDAAWNRQGGDHWNSGCVNSENDICMTHIQIFGLLVLDYISTIYIQVNALHCGSGLLVKHANDSQSTFWTVCSYIIHTSTAWNVSLYLHSTNHSTMNRVNHLNTESLQTLFFL